MSEIHTTSESSGASALNRLQLVLSVAILGALIILLLVKVLSVATLFEKPGELLNATAPNPYVARRVQQGGEIYGDWRVRPHVLAMYGPAQYWPVGLIGRWTGADVQGLYTIGRSISVLATAGTVLLIVWMLWHGLAVHPVIAVAMGLVFFTADGILVRFDLAFRADAPGCFLTMLGLALLVRADRRACLYGSVLAFLGAILYKQSFVAGPVAAVLWLGLTRRRRDAVTYAVLSLVCLGGAVALLNVVTEGRHYLNTVKGLAGNTTLSSIPMLLHELIQQAAVPVVVAVYVLAIECYRREWHVVSVLFAVSMILTAASTYRDGSCINYYMPSFAVACVITGRCVGRWWQERSTAPAGATALTFVLVLAAVWYIPEAGLSTCELPTRWETFTRRHEQFDRRAKFFRDLADYLNDLDGPVLCQFNDIGLHCPRSIMVDTSTFSGMADVGAFDDRPLIDQIRRGQVAAIVINPRAAPVYQSTEMVSRRWRKAMTGRYRLVRVPGLAWAHIYRPVTQERPRSTDLLGPPL